MTGNGVYKLFMVMTAGWIIIVLTTLDVYNIWMWRCPEIGVSLNNPF